MVHLNKLFLIGQAFILVEVVIFFEKNCCTILNMMLFMLRSLNKVSLGHSSSANLACVKLVLIPRNIQYTHIHTQHTLITTTESL